jgi:hypothetical protein
MLNTIRQFLNVNATKQQVPELGKVEKKVLPFPEVDPHDESVVPFPVRG